MSGVGTSKVFFPSLLELQQKYNSTLTISLAALSNNISNMLFLKREIKKGRQEESLVSLVVGM